MDSQIYLCCLNGFMPQKVSYIYEWYPSFKHVNCFAMTETVWGIIFFLKVIRIITFCQSYIFADKVSDTCSCYSVRTLAWMLMLTSDGNVKTLLPVSELPCILSLIQ